jgi:malate dehydrogenase (oxaloacetate-decarboxylating)(NADP+)
MQRRGLLYRDCVRMVANDRTLCAASMLAAGEPMRWLPVSRAHTTGRSHDVRTVLDSPRGSPVGVMLIFTKGRLVFVGDTSVHEMPTSEELAGIALQTAAVAKRFGFTPRRRCWRPPPALPHERSERIVEAVNILGRRGVDFSIDGEVAADVALDREEDGALSVLPFDRHGKRPHHAGHPLGVDLDKLLSQIGGVTMMGPLLVGLEKSGSDRAARREDGGIYNERGGCALA